jgi:hypothetical protein
MHPKTTQSLPIPCHESSRHSNFHSFAKVRHHPLRLASLSPLTVLPVLHRLRSRVQDEMTDLTRSKVLLIGESKCGKRTLFESLSKEHSWSGGKQGATAAPAATSGHNADIQVSNWLLKSNNAAEVLFTAWNMRCDAPSSPMSSMHALFATPLTLFCIVFDIRSKDTTRLEYWVSSVVRAVGKTAKIVLVGTFVVHPHTSAMLIANLRLIMSCRYPFLYRHGDSVSSAHQATVIEKIRYRLESFSVLDIHVVSNTTRTGSLYCPFPTHRLSFNY